MKKTKLAHAVAMAITGTALSMGAVSTARQLPHHVQHGYSGLVLSQQQFRGIAYRRHRRLVHNGTGGTGNQRLTQLPNLGFVGISGANAITHSHTLRLCRDFTLNWGVAYHCSGDTANFQGCWDCNFTLRYSDLAKSTPAPAPGRMQHRQTDTTLPDLPAGNTRPTSA